MLINDQIDIRTPNDKYGVNDEELHDFYKNVDKHRTNITKSLKDDGNFDLFESEGFPRLKPSDLKLHHFYITKNPISGDIYASVSAYPSDPELDKAYYYHTIGIEYDPKTKKAHISSFDG